jgi:hypothetical protein
VRDGASNCSREAGRRDGGEGQGGRKGICPKSVVGQQGCRLHSSCLQAEVGGRIGDDHLQRRKAHKALKLGRNRSEVRSGASIRFNTEEDSGSVRHSESPSYGRTKENAMKAQ